MRGWSTCGKGDIRMAILEKEILIKLSRTNIKHYKNIGYDIPTYLNNKGKTVISYEENIQIRVHDLHDGSTVKITKVCDDCGKHVLNQNYSRVIKSRSKTNKDMCLECSKAYIAKKKKDNVPYERSLEHYAMINKKDHLLTMFSPKNKKSPDKVYFGSGVKYLWICPLCAYVKHETVRCIIHYGIRCQKCSDGHTFPEKIMMNLLSQLKIMHVKEKTFQWSKGRRYDFYIPTLDCIIETHGRQHYFGGFEKIGGRNLEIERENDKLKESLAIENGIKNYIVIDCKESDFTYIKNNIQGSKLASIFDFSEFNWRDCYKYSVDTLVKTVSELWNKELSIKEISKECNLSQFTVKKYLKQGNDIGWNSYHSKEEQRKNAIKTGNMNRRKIIQLSMQGEFIQEWESISSAEREFNITSIGKVLVGKHGTAAGYRWIYADNFYSNSNVNNFKINKRKKKVIQKNLEGVFINEFNSITEASRVLKINSTSISRCCRGIIDKAGGFLWEYCQK